MAAAEAAAERLGLPVMDPAVVGTSSNVVVHLRPHPVVARVMVGTTLLHPDPRGWLTGELAVGRHLAAAGAPVVAPTDMADPGPHEVDGTWLTLWEHVEVLPDVRPSPADAGRALRELHVALATHRADLPPRADVLHEVDVLLDLLAAAADPPAGRAEVAALRGRRDALADAILAADDPADARRQPLHGDAALSALLPTPAGLRWVDLEDACVGRVEWDVAGLLADVRARHGEEGAADALDAYGAPCDPDLLALATEVDDLYGELWRRTAPLRA